MPDCRGPDLGPSRGPCFLIQVARHDSLFVAVTIGEAGFSCFPGIVICLAFFGRELAEKGQVHKVPSVTSDRGRV